MGAPRTDRGCSGISHEAEPRTSVETCGGVASPTLDWTGGFLSEAPGRGALRGRAPGLERVRVSQILVWTRSMGSQTSVLRD